MTFVMNTDRWQVLSFYPDILRGMKTDFFHCDYEYEHLSSCIHSEVLGTDPGTFISFGIQNPLRFIFTKTCQVRKRRKKRGVEVKIFIFTILVNVYHLNHGVYKNIERLSE